MIYLENICEEYQYTIRAVGVLLTFLTVIIALYSTYRALKIQKCKIKTKLNFQNKDGNIYFSVEIINVGLVPIKLARSCLQLKIPFKDSICIPCYDFQASIIKTPLIIEANDSIKIKIEVGGGRNYLKDYLTKNLKGVNPLFLYFKKMNLVTRNYQKFKLKVPRSFSKEIRGLIK